MVPFKYDPKVLTNKNWGPPFADDKIGPTGTPGGSADPAGSFGVVWGCKPPELLLSESAAFHNRGVADTKYATPSKNTREASTGAGTAAQPYQPANPDMDQVRVPQGSLFIELYCPRSATNQTAPTDLYTYGAAAGGWCLDVGRTAPDNTPVWRIVVSMSRLSYPNSDVSTRLTATPDSSAIEPEQYPGDTTAEFTLLLGQNTTAVPNVQMERQFFMTTTAPPATLAGASTMSYYNLSTRSNANSPRAAAICPAGNTWCWGRGDGRTSAPKSAPP